MISYEILVEQGIVIIMPAGPLEHKDFEYLTKEVDEHIERVGDLNGLIIHAKSFPGWENLEAFIDHIRFIKDHHRKIKRVAAVIDGTLTTIMPKLVNHFVSAEVKHFDYNEMDAARNWVLGK
jgi:hypothetical protein